MLKGRMLRYIDMKYNANIVPRSKAVYERYTQFFGEKFTSQNRYKIFPGIY